MGQDDNAFIGGSGRKYARGGGEVACTMGTGLRMVSGARAHPRQLTLELVVALFLTFLGCLLLLLKGGVVGGDELVLVRALVVMVAQHGLKQM